MILGVAFAVGCKHKPNRETGNIEVDYGKLVEDGGTVMNIPYGDETPITFMYPNYFTRSSDEEDPFVAKGPDDNSVLMYVQSELSEGRGYNDIAAYTDEQAKDWMTTIQLGLVSSQGVEKLDIDDFRFEKLDDHLYLYLDATATYSTGLMQKNTIVDYVLPEGTMYTVNAFAPLSAVTKYGPLFSSVKYKGVDADKPFGENEEETPEYLEFNNGHISFKYKNAFTASETNGAILSMVPEKLAMLAGSSGALEEGRTYEQLAALEGGELADYLASATALPVSELEYANASEENGVLRLEARYSGDTASGQKLYCVVVRFVEKSGDMYTLFSYMNEPEPIKDISYTA